MSATKFYLESGRSPVFKFKSHEGGGTAAVWSVTTSTRIALTDLIVSSVNGGTVAFYFGTDANFHTGGTKLTEFYVAGSSSVGHSVLFLDDFYDRNLYMNVSAGGTDGWKVTAAGFELP